MSWQINTPRQSVSTTNQFHQTLVKEILYNIPVGPGQAGVVHCKPVPVQVVQLLLGRAGQLLQPTRRERERG